MPLSCWMIVTVNVPDKVNNLTLRVSVLEKVPSIIEIVWPNKVVSALTYMAKGDWQGRRVIKRSTGRELPLSATSRLQFTFKQVSEVLHVPDTVAPVLRALVKFPTDAHISSSGVGEGGVLQYMMRLAFSIRVSFWEGPNSLDTCITWSRETKVVVKFKVYSMNALDAISASWLYLFHYLYTQVIGLIVVWCELTESKMPWSTWTIATFTVPEMKYIINGMVAFLEKVPFSMENVWPMKVMLVFTDMAKGLWQGRWVTEREPGKVRSPSWIARSQSTFKQVSEMVHMPVTVSLVLNTFVRLLTEAHISSRPFGGQ